VPVTVSSGSDVLDAALCQLGVFARTPMRGAARRLRNHRLSPAELVAGSRIPERFRAVHILYLDAYARRISNVYATTRHKHNSLEHFWCFLDERFPEITGVRAGASRARARVSSPTRSSWRDHASARYGPTTGRRV
jgi:hypothetical protein